MGTQIHFQAKDILEAGYLIEYSAEIIEQDGENYTLVTAKICVGFGSNYIYLSCDVNDLFSLWSDYNNWGTNKERIQKFFGDNFPKHIIS